MSKPTAEELEFLTEDELAALEIDENATDGDEEEEELPEAAEEKPKDPAPEEEPEKEEKATKDAEELPESDEKDEQTDDKEETDDSKDQAEEVEEPGELPEVDFVPQISKELPDELKAKIDADAKELNADLEQKLAALKDEYEDGDLDAAEYFDQASAIRDQINENRLEVRDAVRNDYIEQQTAAQRWEAEQDAFFKLNSQYDAPVYDKDTGELKSGNPILYGALDAACQAISRREPKLSGVDLLMKAKAEVDKELGLAKAAEPGKDKRPSSRRPNKSLGDLPSVAPEDAGAGEFANLDKLSGDALEDALEKLPEDKRERYLAGA